MVSKTLASLRLPFTDLLYSKPTIFFPHARHRCRNGHGRGGPNDSCRIIRKSIRAKRRGTFSYRNLCHPERRFQGSRHYTDSNPSIAVVTYERCPLILVI